MLPVHWWSVFDGAVDVRDHSEGVRVSITGTGGVRKIVHMPAADGIRAGGPAGKFVKMSLIRVGAEEHFVHMIPGSGRNRPAGNGGKAVIVRVTADFGDSDAALYLVQMGFLSGRAVCASILHNGTSFLSLGIPALLIVCISRGRVPCDRSGNKREPRRPSVSAPRRSESATFFRWKHTG